MLWHMTICTMYASTKKVGISTCEIHTLHCLHMWHRQSTLPTHTLMCSLSTLHVCGLVVLWWTSSSWEDQSYNKQECSFEGSKAVWSSNKAVSVFGRKRISWHVVAKTRNRVVMTAFAIGSCSFTRKRITINIAIVSIQCTFTCLGTLLQYCLQLSSS